MRQSPGPSSTIATAAGPGAGEPRPGRLDSLPRRQSQRPARTRRGQHNHLGKRELLLHRRTRQLLRTAHRPRRLDAEHAQSSPHQRLDLGGPGNNRQYRRSGDTDAHTDTDAHAHTDTDTDADAHTDAPTPPQIPSLMNVLRVSHGHRWWGRRAEFQLSFDLVLNATTASDRRQLPGHAAETFPTFASPHGQDHIGDLQRVEQLRHAHSGPICTREADAIDDHGPDLRGHRDRDDRHPTH